ncbi:hypothetical protein V5O48_003141 [Marasmius crinis-equi]|uniref:FAD-binding PCMH-type domain-containing protein n=1 Tax=Marasmius crinis-equi TaxID=585013 RepID=A0ABR3FTQ2_9AGAR
MTCQKLQEELSPIVHFPGSAEYQSRVDVYYALQQANMQSACRVSPTSPSEVSRVVQIAKINNCPFAVCSGGKMGWAGSSNINEGFVIDMHKLNQIEVFPENGVVRLGPGATWSEVYSALEPLNTTVVGGRISNVGVGGFLLGGGISWLSFTKGFCSDSVLNYEVVLSDGTIVNVNKDSNPDLYWALKVGGTNYGIVTRFDMPAIPLSTVWASQDIYPVEESLTLDVLSKWISHFKQQDRHPKDVRMGMLSQSNGMGVMIAVNTHLDPSPREPLTSATPIMHDIATGSLHHVTNKIFGAETYPPSRTSWSTLTIGADEHLIWDIYTRGDDLFKGLQDREGLQWNMLFQAITKTFIEGSSGSPIYHSLKNAGDDLILITFITGWKSAADDQVIEETSDKLVAWAEAEASRRGLLNDFVYMNYANKKQHVYERSVTKGDLTRMRNVKERYDSTGTFNRLWRGGFKLPKEEVAEHDSSEL